MARSGNGAVKHLLLGPEESSMGEVDVDRIVRAFASFDSLLARQCAQIGFNYRFEMRNFPFKLDHDPLFRRDLQPAITRRVRDALVQCHYMKAVFSLKQNCAFQMRASEQWLKAVDDWRRVQPDLPRRAEAIRRLVEIALKADQKPD